LSPLSLIPPNGEKDFSMRRCRSCKTLKWGADPCPNADCPKNTGDPVIRVKSRSRPITATAKHGYHAPNTTGFIQGTSDYDAPIRSTWRTIS
jgi:hypothetical protein